MLCMQIDFVLNLYVKISILLMSLSSLDMKLYCTPKFKKKKYQNNTS